MAALYGLEQQTKRKRERGSGQTAALGTSPTGLVISRIMQKIMMVMVKTVHFSLATGQSTRVGTTFHATGGN